MFRVGITVGLHELLRTNYCGSSNYGAPTTTETPITARELTINLGMLNILFNLNY